MLGSDLHHEVVALYTLGNPDKEFARWKQLIKQHQDDGSLFEFAYSVLTNKVGIWFVCEHLNEL